jgi:iron(III) transport system ATP-binding protein
VIAISDLQKNFQSGQQIVMALKGIDLNVSKGEFFVLLGPSGSGKTTLMRCVAGLETPDCGTICLDGKTVFSVRPRINIPPEERQIGMVFQSYAIWPHMTVAENIGLVLSHGQSRLPQKQLKGRIQHALGLVQLENFEDRPARLLSGGQQQRVALARALAINPKLLLMDEPLSNLDARLREEVRTKIKKLAVQLGITALYVTHDQIEAMVLADRIGVMAQGAILQVGKPHELYRAPKSSLVAEFFGSINWLRGTMINENRVATQIGTLAVENSNGNTGSVIVGVRPEDVKLAATSTAAENQLKGKVVSAIFIGDQVIAEVKIHETTLTVKTTPDDQKPPGDVLVYLPKGRIVVFSDVASGAPGA